MSDTENTAAPVEALQTDSGPRSNANEQADAPKQDEATPEAVAGNGPESDEEEDADAPETPETPEPERKKRKTLQDRLNELTAEKYASKSEADQARQERDELRKQLESLKSQPAKTEESATKTLEDFDFDYAAHSDYLIELKVKRALVEKETQERQSAQERDRAEKVRKFETGVAAAIAARPEVQNLVYNPLAQFYPQDMVEFVYDSDASVELGTYLGENIAETDAILRMEPAPRLRALSRIEAKLSQPATAQPRTFTQAPAPVRSLSGNAPVKRDLGEMSMDEFAAERKRQISGKRR